jgi:hypothetical protein
MVMRNRPNEELRLLLTEAGWTGEQLARTVNRLGAEIGATLRYDRTAVSHWLAGIRPRPPVPGLIAEAFARRLARPVTAADAGVGPSAPAPRQEPGPSGLAAELGNLSRAQTGAGSGSRVLPEFRYSLAALAVPAWAWELPGWPERTRASAAPAGTAEAEAAESIGRVFLAGDAAFGGGSTRRALAAYLSQDLAPRLTAPARPAIRRRLHLAAAQLTYLCGFMSFDDELNGLAQRYYLTALRLCTDANDQINYAVTLRAMSVQALALGHRRHAVHLAEAAAASGRAAGPARQAFLYGQLAVAHAADGDPHNAVAALAAAERRIDQATSTLLVGACHPASLAHQRAAVQALLGDCKGAAGALVQSIRHRPATERRSRAITLARLAELQLRQGHLDEATATWHTFLDDHFHLTSGRADTALVTMRAMLRPHTGRPAVRTLLARTARPV